MSYIILQNHIDHLMHLIRSSLLDLEETLEENPIEKTDKIIKQMRKNLDELDKVFCS